MALTLDGTTGISATGNIYGNNIIVANALIIGSFSPAVLSVAGNVTGGNLLTSGLISATGNVNGNYILGNGALLTGVITSVANINSGTSNVTVVSSGGNVSVGVGGTSNVAVFATTGEYITGVVSASGNITGSNLLTDGLISATSSIISAANITGGNILTGGLISATSSIISAANITGGNILTGGLISATSSIISAANITGGNVLTGGIISATGNITGNYLLGNGSQLTGIDATSIQNGTSNAKVVSSGGNVSVSVGGTSNVAVFATTGEYITGVISANGNVTGGNVLTGGLISATGNVTGGNVNAGNITIAADLISSLGATLTIDPATIGNEGLVIINGNLQVNGTTTTINSNVVSTNDLTVNYANNAVNSAAANGGGIEVGPIGSPYITWLYNSTANVWVSSGGISAVGNVTGGNIATGGLISATGAITGAAITGSSLTVLTGTITGGNIVNGNGNGIGNIGSSSVYFNTGFLKATTAQYADLAELYVADATYAPGTVLDFGGAKEVTLSSVASSARVAGVVSTNPAHLMNSMIQDDTTVPVALQGRVPTSVTGTVRKGDMMVSAGNGVARACATPSMGTVIGKALADFDGVSGTIEIVVGRL